MPSEQSALNPRPSQGSGSDRSPGPAERLGLGAHESVVNQPLFPDCRVHLSSTLDQGVMAEGGLTVVMLRHDSSEERRTRSEGSTNIHPTHSEEKSATHDRKREPERESHYKATPIYGASAPELSEDKGHLPSKQYTKFWYCHINCQDRGPWRSQLTRCLGCEHDRCIQCEEETVVTRDPSAPRR